MSKAIERLAAELMKLSNDEWSGAVARWQAGGDWDEVFGAAWDEISERLCDVDRDGLAASDAAAADEMPGDALPQLRIRPQPQT